MPNYFKIIVVLLLVVIVSNTAYSQVKDIEAQAKRDAQVNMWIWMGGGCLLSAMSSCLAIGITLRAGYEGPSSDYFSYGFPNPDYGCVLSASPVINSVGLLSVLLTKPNVPPTRLLGKSPEEIEVYTKAYQKSVRTKRFLYASIGSIAALGYQLGVYIVNSGD